MSGETVDYSRIPTFERFFVCGQHFSHLKWLKVYAIVFHLMTVILTQITTSLLKPDYQLNKNILRLLVLATRLSVECPRIPDFSFRTT